MIDSLWTQQALEELIKNQAQESLKLDYKGSGSLKKDSKSRNEIQKDVSAMANSAGGIIIYGIAEFKEKEKKHLPERIDPVNQTEITKEWLESIINNIERRIAGIVITPVPISLNNNPNEVVYVVEIPQGQTAHQCPADLKYYRRFNFQSVPMHDYEIRDVMQRGSTPRVEPEFEVVVEHRTIASKKLALGQYSVTSETQTVERSETVAQLKIYVHNIGNVFAKHIVCHLTLPKYLLDPSNDRGTDDENDQSTTFRLDNIERHYSGMVLVNVTYKPVLPGTKELLSNIRLNLRVADGKETSELLWKIHADNATAQSGKLTFAEISISNQVKHYEEDFLGQRYE